MIDIFITFMVVVTWDIHMHKFTKLIHFLFTFFVNQLYINKAKILNFMVRKTIKLKVVLFLLLTDAKYTNSL